MRRSLWFENYPPRSPALIRRFDRVEIDRSFIQHLGPADDPTPSAAIVRAIVDLCTALEMTTLAEGVETEEQFATLTALGCHDVQGFLFDRPCPAAQVESILDRLNTGDPGPFDCVAEISGRPQPGHLIVSLRNADLRWLPKFQHSVQHEPSP